MFRKTNKIKTTNTIWTIIYVDKELLSDLDEI